MNKKDLFMAELNKQMPNGQPCDEADNLSKASIIEALGGVDNADLIDLLSEWRMDNSLYVYPLMEMKGYEIDYSFETVTFKHPKAEAFEVAVKTLKDLCFKAVKERSVDYRLDRLIVSYLQCNVQQSYCIFDPWGYFPNGNKEILSLEEPDVFIVDKQRKVAVSHATLLSKLNEQLQLNEATNVKYNKLWQGYRSSVAERYPEELSKLLLSDEPIRTSLSQNLYHRDSYGLCFIELSNNKVVRIPSHILKEFASVCLAYQAEDQTEHKQQEVKVEQEAKDSKAQEQANKKESQDVKSSARENDKASQKSEQDKNQSRSKVNVRQSQNNQRQNNNGRRGRNDYNGRAGRDTKANAKFNTDRYLISEDELNYVIPVGWRNQLLSWGAFGRFILDVWLSFKILGRIRNNRD